jgi:hypothetical protein
MPFRNFPEWIANLPQWLQVMVGFLSMLGAAGMGAMAKIADDVKSGNRDRFWTKKLFLEVPAVGMMALIGWGVAEHYGMGVGASVALGSFLGWAGPKTVEAIISMKMPSSWRK